MKTISFKFIIAAMVAVATMVVSPSCQKETAGTQDLVKEGETIQVSINAGLGGFVAADATKATATPVVRFEWESTDKVDAYYGDTKISGDARISVTPSEIKIFAKLTGTIDASGYTIGDDDIITFVYSNLAASKVSGLTFDFSSQDATIPFVAYATVKWSEIKSGLTDKILEFKFATSVMKIAATNLGGGDISSATIDGINTKVTLAPQTSSETVTITGSEASTITKTAGFDASSDKTRAIFTVGLVPEGANSNRKLTINGRKMNLTTNEIAASKSYTTPCAFEEVEFVEIGGKKWATKNLGADKAEDYGKLYSWGNLGGQRGDSFDPSFSSTNYDNSQGKSITSATGSTGWVTTKHDAAYNEWGGTWRMPTQADFTALANACNDGGYTTGTITLDASHKNISTAVGVTAKGIYYCNNYEDGDGIKGLLFHDGINKLFFPAAGYSDGTSRSYGGSYGRYWSSTLSSSSTNAYDLYFNVSNVYPQTYNNRYFGISVRPVSD